MRINDGTEGIKVSGQCTICSQAAVEPIAFNGEPTSIPLETMKGITGDCATVEAVCRQGDKVVASGSVRLDADKGKTGTKRKAEETCGADEEEVLEDEGCGVPQDVNPWNATDNQIVRGTGGGLTEGSKSELGGCADSKEGLEEMSYADAVLAGLPPDDEAVQLMGLAKEAGKTLDDVLEFCYHSSAAASGKCLDDDPLSYQVADVVGEHAEDASLYKEMHHWCDSTNVEAQLRKSHEARTKGLPRQGWKRKKRKQ